MSKFKIGSHFMSTMAPAGPSRIISASRPNAASTPASQADIKNQTWPATMLLVSFAIPWLVQVGPITLSIYKVVLLTLTVPCIFMWLSGKTGRVRLADLALLLFCLWCSIGLAVLHGPSVAIEAGGVLFIETFGAYLVARCYIRTIEQFRHMVSVALVIIACLLPFAAFEAFTGYNLGRNIFSAILPTYQPDSANEMRAGLARAMVTLDHPILFGLFAGCTFALVHLVRGRNKTFLGRWFPSAIVVLTTFFSLSSAPIGTLVLQIALIGWNWLWRNNRLRWKFLWAMAALSYVVISIGSSQNPIQFYVSRFTFDPQTAWYRFLIWEYGTASIAAHPLFGVGFGEWVRAAFMSPSVDNFWIIVPLRHGLPAGIFLYCAFLSVYLRVAFSRQPNPIREDYKTAYLITMTALFLIGWSVHFWGPPYVLLMFLMGSGIWMLEPQGATTANQNSAFPLEKLRGGAAVAHLAVRRVRTSGKRAAA